MTNRVDKLIAPSELSMNSKLGPRGSSKHFELAIQEESVLVLIAQASRDMIP